MREYKPTYDTNIKTKTIIERQNTMHLTWIDWDNYPFENDTSEPDAVEKKKEYLRICEQCKAKEIRASKYNMYSQKVYGVCMASCWPYWKPRPTVLLKSALGGMEWVDWTAIAWAREAEAIA